MLVWFDSGSMILFYIVHAMSSAIFLCKDLYSVILVNCSRTVSTTTIALWTCLIYMYILNICCYVNLLLC